MKINDFPQVATQSCSVAKGCNLLTKRWGLIEKNNPAKEETKSLILMVNLGGVEVAREGP